MKESPSAPVASVSPRRTFDEVCARIRALVSSGELRPGDKLPPERELAETMGVSRTVIREALRNLESAGLVSLHRGPLGGAFIQGGDAGLVTRTLQDLVSLGTVSIADLTDARIQLTAPIVKLACERATEADLRSLEANVEQLARVLGDEQHAERFQCAMDFYRILGAATKNEILSIVVNALNGIAHDVLAPFMREQRDTVLRDALLASRREFVRHMRARDPEAASAEMTRHLTDLRDHTLARRGPRLPVSGRSR